jgi:serine/threonine protein kinase
MAPEILSSGGKGYDVKVDIWSVGCIVLEMWTGDRPWSGEELLPVLMKVFPAALTASGAPLNVISFLNINCHHPFHKI